MNSSPASPVQDPCRLASLRCDTAGIVERLEGPPSVQLRLLELGVTPGERIVLRYITPFGGPMEIELMNYRLAIRRTEAKNIWVRRSPDTPQ